MARSRRFPVETDLVGEFLCCEKQRHARSSRYEAREYCRLVVAGIDPDEVENMLHHRNRDQRVVKTYAPVAIELSRK